MVRIEGTFDLKRRGDRTYRTLNDPYSDCFDEGSHGIGEEDDREQRYQVSQSRASSKPLPSGDGTA